MAWDYLRIIIGKGDILVDYLLTVYVSYPEGERTLAISADSK